MSDAMTVEQIAATLLSMSAKSYMEGLDKTVQKLGVGSHMEFDTARRGAELAAAELAVAVERVLGGQTDGARARQRFQIAKEFMEEVNAAGTWSLAFEKHLAVWEAKAREEQP